MSELTQDQLSVLIEHRRLTEQGEEVEVVPKSAADAAREVLGEALKKRDKSANPEALSLPGLVNQFTDESSREEAVASLASQHPATGGNPGDDADTNGFSVESLSAGKARDAYKDRKLIESLKDRTPEHAERKKQELADDLGCTVDELPSKKEFQDALR